MGFRKPWSWRVDTRIFFKSRLIIIILLHMLKIIFVENVLFVARNRPTSSKFLRLK
jgi:hypothetical protein